jgi:hypothetical protein
MNPASERLLSHEGIILQVLKPPWKILAEAGSFGHQPTPSI